MEDKIHVTIEIRGSEIEIALISVHLTNTLKSDDFTSSGAQWELLNAKLEFLSSTSLTITGYYEGVLASNVFHFLASFCGYPGVLVDIYEIIYNNSFHKSECELILFHNIFTQYLNGDKSYYHGRDDMELNYLTNSNLYGFEVIKSSFFKGDPIEDIIPKVLEYGKIHLKDYYEKNL